MIEVDIGNNRLL